jgi:hypothetical protein
MLSAGGHAKLPHENSIENKICYCNVAVTNIANPRRFSSAQKNMFTSQQSFVTCSFAALRDKAAFARWIGAVQSF